jgi:hypothetical protein
LITAGVVHEDVGPAELVDAVRESAHRRRVAHVRGERQRLTAGGSDLGGRLFRAREVLPAGQHDARAGGGELAGNGAARSRGSRP